MKNILFAIPALCLALGVLPGCAKKAEAADPVVYGTIYTAEEENGALAEAFKKTGDASGIEQTNAVNMSEKDGSQVLFEADSSKSQNDTIDLKAVTFYYINPDYNTLGKEIRQQEDGAYYLPSETGVFIDFYDGTGLKPITAYFAPKGANHTKQIAFANPPWPQMPIALKLSFAEDDTEGVLFFVFDCADGTSVKSKEFSVFIEHSEISSPSDIVDG